eukprot:g8370.t1
MSLENHGGGVSSGALLQKCNVLNDATLNIASRYYPAASAAVAVAPGAGTFGTLQITATNAGDVSGAIINSINAVGNSVKTLAVFAIPTSGQTRHTAQENRRATTLEIYRSKLRAGFLPPTNSFLLSPHECLTIEWVKPPVEQKVAKPAPYLPTPSTSPPTSSFSSSSATRPPAKSGTTTLPSFVPNPAMETTAEGEEESLPYLSAPSTSPPMSSPSSSSATHPPARPGTSTLPSSVPNPARKMTTEEEED